MQFDVSHLLIRQGAPGHISGTGVDTVGCTPLTRVSGFEATGRNV